jgi:pimeloyl-ACP methyl ester carboxylesterase
MVLGLARQAIKVLPAPAALAVIRTLAGRTQRAAVLPFQEEAMVQATRLSYGERHAHAAWAWGQGPLVVFVHGWGGRAAHMAPVALDVTGHGESPASHARWSYFPRDVAELARSLGGEIFAYVGHSAGGLTMMAARALQGIRARRYVCISAPSHPYPPIRAVKAKLNPRPGALELYRNFIAGDLGTTWDRLEAGCAYAGAGSDLLLCYDKADKFVDHAEGDRILALCPGARLTKTTAYGHLKILSAPEVAVAVGEFLKPPA